jgi:hypothetical protein
MSLDSETNSINMFKGTVFEDDVELPVAEVKGPAWVQVVTVIANVIHFIGRVSMAVTGLVFGLIYYVAYETVYNLYLFVRGVFVRYDVYSLESHRHCSTHL